jgi:hypothetical protein
MQKNGQLVGTCMRRNWLEEATGPKDALRMGNANDTKWSAIMSMLTTKDNTSIYYKDWGSGRPIVFSHGWPLNSDQVRSNRVGSSKTPSWSSTPARRTDSPKPTKRSSTQTY